MTSSEFQRDNEWQQRLAAKFLDPFYRLRGWRVTRYPDNHPLQKLHVDVRLHRDNQTRTHTIDEKIMRGRRDGQRAKKISLETWSCSVPGMERRGWFAKDEPSRASILMFCFADISDLGPDSWQDVSALDCVWMPFRPLKDWFWQQGEDRWELRDNRQINRTLYRSVPIAEIVQADIGLQRFLINQHSLTNDSLRADARSLMSDAELAGYPNGFVGYDKDGHFLAFCHCGQSAPFGYGSFLLQGKLGTWYCREHRPNAATMPGTPG